MKRTYTCANKLKLLRRYKEANNLGKELILKEHNISLGEIAEWITLEGLYGVQGLKAGAAGKGKRL